MISARGLCWKDDSTQIHKSETETLTERSRNIAYHVASSTAEVHFRIYPEVPAAQTDTLEYVNSCITLRVHAISWSHENVRVLDARPLPSRPLGVSYLREAKATHFNPASAHQVNG